MSWLGHLRSVGMRIPDFKTDGWSLENGEEYHREAPDSFFIPDLEVRQILQPGDFAKLIFRIAVADESEPEAYERMWVIVRERTSGGYLGILASEPDSIEQNDEFWLGTELPFEPKHIIAVDHANSESIETAKQPPGVPWRRA
jgi:hypothetical protein